jgi:hypothetical protein
VAAFRTAARPFIDWLSDALVRSDESIGRLLTEASDLFELSTCDDPQIGVGEWRWNTSDPHLLDLPDYRANEPWALNAGCSTRARIEVVGHPERASALSAAAPQVAGRRLALQLPGAVPVNHVVHAAVAKVRGVPPRPWTEPEAFRAWLSAEYWKAIRESRTDLVAAFPQSDDYAAPFHDWCRQAPMHDEASMLMEIGERPRGTVRVVEPTYPAGHVRPARASSDGVNVIGYLSRELGLGEIARRLVEAIESSGIPVNAVDHQRSNSPVIAPLNGQGSRSFRTTLAVVNADQFAGLAVDHPELMARTERTIGYWFWELDSLTREMRR